MKRTLLGAIAAAATVLFADLAGLNLAWSNWFDAGIASLTEGGALTSEWTAPSAADDCAVVTKDGASVIEIDTDEELVYTPATSPSSPIVRCDISVYPALHGGFPSEVPADGVQTMLVPYTNDGVVAWAACVKVSGETNWVSLTGVTPNPNALTDVRIEFDYRSTPKVSFLVKSNGDYVALQDGGANTWFDTLSDKTSVSSFAFTGEGAVASLAGANGYAVDPGSVALYGGTGYATFEAAIAAAAADGYSAGPVTLLADVSWTPAAAGAYQIDVNGNTLTINGAGGSWSGTTYTVTALNNYYWIGGASGAWDNGANWSHVAGGAAAGEYPNSESHSAFFSTGATINLSNKIATVNRIFTDGELTFLGDSTINSRIRTSPNSNNGKLYMGGTGKVRLAGVALYASYATSEAAAANEITNALEIVEGTTNFVRISGASDRYASIYLRGALSGGGTLIVFGNTESGHYQAYFYGDALGFTGILADCREGDDYAARLNFMTAASLSSLATYNLSATYNAGGQNYVLRAGGTGTTYRMGALNGEVHFDGNNNTKTTQYYGYTLEIGGKNEDCSFGGTLARSGYASYTKKVGTADMTFTGSQIPYLDIANGTYIIGAATALPDTAMTFSGGAFSVAEGVSVDPVSKFAADSTAAVVFDDRGLDNTWDGGLIDSRVPYGFTKKGAGTLTLTTAPTHTTKTTVEEGVLVVPQGTTIAELSCAGGKLTVPLTGEEDETTVLNITALAAGTDYDALTNAVAIPGVTVAVESDGVTGYAVKATRTPQTFTWTGVVDADWSKGGNWTVGGVAATTAPLAIDTVLFASAGASVSLDSGATVAKIVVDAATTFSIPDNSPLRSPLVCGDGVITLAEGFFAPINSSSSSCVISNDIVFAEGYDGRAYLAGADYQSISLRGDISGTGTLTIYEGNHRNAGIQFHGSAEGFSGAIVVECSNQYRRDTTKFLTTNAVNANVAYSFWGNDGDDTFVVAEGESDKYWRLGSVDGRVYMTTMKATGHTLEVGALNTDFSCGGTIGHKNGSGVWYYLNTVRKVGTGTFTSSINYAGTYDVAEGNLLLETNALPITAITFNGGTLVLTNAFNETDLDIAATIKNSASPIAIDTGDDDYTFATALEASNAGGLTKKGAGTLTLSAVPLYKGITTVEEGSLVVPLGTEVTLNALYASNVPENATVVGYGYADGTELTWAAAAPTYDKPLNVAGLKKVDLTGATIANGLVVVKASDITGLDWQNVELVLPEGAKQNYWRLRVTGAAGGGKALVLLPIRMPTVFTLR